MKPFIAYLTERARPGKSSAKINNLESPGAGVELKVEMNTFKQLHDLSKTGKSARALMSKVISATKGKDKSEVNKIRSGLESKISAIKDSALKEVESDIKDLESLVETKMKDIVKKLDTSVDAAIKKVKI